MCILDGGRIKTLTHKQNKSSQKPHTSAKENMVWITESVSGYDAKFRTFWPPVKIRGGVGEISESHIVASPTTEPRVNIW